MARTKLTARKCNDGIARMAARVRREQEEEEPEEPILIEDDEEEEQEERPPHYRQVNVSVTNGEGIGGCPRMLCKMLEDLGYEKPPQYRGTEAVEEGVTKWFVEVHIFAPHSSNGVYEVERIHRAIAARSCFEDGIRDAARQALLVIRSRFRDDLEHTEYAHYPHRASGHTYVHVDSVHAPGQYKLKRQVELTRALTKDLDNTTEELEYWRTKYVKAAQTIRGLKRRLPQDLELSSDEETDESTPYSPDRRNATRAPPAYIPNPDED